MKLTLGVPSLHFCLLTLLACLMVAPAYSNGFLIVPTYDTSIASDPNAAAIEGAIQMALNQYESLFTNNMTVNIYVEETTFPGAVGLSDDGTYSGSFSLLYSHLVANDANPAAMAALGANQPAGNPNIDIKAPDGRALGFNTPGVCQLTTTGASQYDLNQLCGGSSGPAYDGIVAFNVGLTYPPGANNGSNYGLVSTAEHEIDEVLGLGSALGNCDPTKPNQPAACVSGATLTLSNDTANGHMAMEDLFRWSAPAGGTRTLSAVCTNTPTSAYFSYGPSTGVIAQFNNSCNGADFGDWSGNSPDRVQDAFGTPGGNPTLGTAEIDALTAIGYNAVPEPAAWSLAGAGFVLLLIRRRRAA